MVIVRIVAALIGGCVGFAAFGAGASIWMGSLFGSNSGGTEMNSFFIFAPIGGLAGILFGAGLALQFTRGPAGPAKGLMIAAASIAVLSFLALSGLAMTHPAPGSRTATSILVVEAQLPAAGLPENPPYRFDAGSVSSIEKTGCSADTCSFTLVIALNDNFSRGVLMLGGDQLDLDPPDIHRSSEWCEWRSSGNARFRFRVNRDE